MAKKKIISTQEVEIIKMISKGLFVSSVLLLPGLAHIHKLFPSYSKRRGYYLKKQMNNLLKDNIIVLGKEIIKLSAKGERLLKFVEVDSLENLSNNERNWNGVWQVISYDIPNKYNSERNYFRLKLKQWNFSLMQKSLWIYPYECSEEVAVLAYSLRISPYVVIMETRHIPEEYKYLKRYALDNSFDPENS